MASSRELQDVSAVFGASGPCAPRHDARSALSERIGECLSVSAVGSGLEGEELPVAGDAFEGVGARS